jgi:hypothetical protein
MTKRRRHLRKKSPADHRAELANELAKLHAKMHADPGLSAFMDECCLILARAIAEDMARDQGGAPEYWVAWIKQNIEAGRLMFDFSPDGKGVRLITAASPISSSR